MTNVSAPRFTAARDLGARDIPLESIRNFVGEFTRGNGRGAVVIANGVGKIVNEHSRLLFSGGFGGGGLKVGNRATGAGQCSSGDWKDLRGKVIKIYVRFDVNDGLVPSKSLMPRKCLWTKSSCPDRIGR